MKVSYYELLKREIGGTTEKAYKIIVGYNGKVKLGTDTNIYKYIAKSLVKEVNDTLYVPAWLVRQENLWDYVDIDNTIQIEDGKKRVRKTKEQKEKENYNRNLKNYFNNNVPNEYLIVYFDEDNYDDYNFRNIDKLESYLTGKHSANIVRLVKVTNGIKEVLRG